MEMPIEYCQNCGKLLDILPDFLVEEADKGKVETKCGSCGYWTQR